MPDGGLTTITIMPPEGKVEIIQAVARDLCKVVTKYAYPVTLDCSLACTPIRWPMESGTLILNFFKQDPNCPQFGNIPSDYFSFDYPEGVAVGLGCNEKHQDGIWQSQDMIYGVFSQSPLLGITFRITSLMTVNPDATLNVSVQMERLVPASETGNPSGLNTFNPCISFSGTLERDLLSNNTDPFSRQEYWVMKNKNPIQLPVPGNTCPFDAKSVNMTVLLKPYRVGCDGTAEGHPEKTDCSLSAINKTYTCLSALIKPATFGVFKPRWVQMGVNPNLSNISGNFSCFNGVNAGPLLDPPVVADLKPDIPWLTPIDNYNFDYDLLNCGCPGENNQRSDKQQIQIGLSREEFNLDYQYQVLVKSVNNGAPCVAIRESGTSIWTIGAYTVDANILAETGHWVATCTFQSVVGDPVVILYGLEFPSGIIANCVNSVANISFAEQIPFSQEQPKIERKINAAQMIAQKMRDVRDKPCKHLGLALETEPTCGCGGSEENKKFRLIHECSIHQKCRISVSGNGIMTCWKCPDYIDQAP